MAYFGTPDFSARFLEKILKDKEIPVEASMVVTQPDKPVGRKQIMTQTPIAKLTNEARYRIFLAPWEPSSNSKQKESQVAKKLISSLQNIDLALVFAFGAVIPQDLLDKPKYGFWNIHPSLLPKYRGASPVAGTLIAGEKETGVTIIKMDEKIDHGSIIAQEKTAILPKEKRPELTKRLTDLAYTMFKELVNVILENDGVKAKEQDHSKATYTKLLNKNDGYVEKSKLKTQNSKVSEEIFNTFLGLYPWPGIWTILRFKNRDLRLKITDMDLQNGSLLLKKVQLEGKKEVDFKQFNEAYRLF